MLPSPIQATLMASSPHRGTCLVRQPVRAVSPTGPPLYDQDRRARLRTGWADRDEEQPGESVHAGRDRGGAPALSGGGRPVGEDRRLASVVRVLHRGRRLLP